MQKNINSRYCIGQQAEISACKYLQQRGIKLLEKNFRCRFGEIDLIMQDGKTIIFIEVRCRQYNAQVNAIESISFAKIKKIRKTAEHYLVQFKQTPNCRFDVIAMTHNDNSIDSTIEWIKSAF